jgi:hypothetical protein
MRNRIVIGLTVLIGVIVVIVALVFAAVQSNAW